MRVLSPAFKLQLRPLLMALVSLWGATAHAGLFEDEDARRAILELRQQRTADGEALAARFKDLNDQIDVLKRSLLDMNAQIEMVRNDLAKERGKNEVLERDVAELQRKQKDIQQAAEERARRFEPVAVNLDGKAFKAEPEEKRLFDDALTKFKSQEFGAVASTLTGLLQRYPNTGYRESAHYWIGNAYYAEAKYNEAIASFRQLINAAPEHGRAPEALLSIANCYSELKDAKQLRKTLDDVIKQYPQSEAAQAAKDRIASTAALKDADAKSGAASKKPRK